MLEVLPNLRLCQGLNQDVTDQLRVEELRRIGLGTGLRHLEFLGVTAGDVAVPGDLLEVGLQLLLAACQELLRDPYLNVLSNPTLVHQVPKSTLGAVNLDDFPANDFLGLTGPRREIQALKFLKHGLLESDGRPQAIGEHGLHETFRLGGGLG